MKRPACSTFHDETNCRRYVTAKGNRNRHYGPHKTNLGIAGLTAEGKILEIPGALTRRQGW